MARCSYCGRGPLRYENYPSIETVQVTQERVEPPPGVRDLGITRNITHHETHVLNGWVFQVCRNCGSVWEGHYEQLLSVHPSKYESYRRRWYDAVRRHRLNLKPHIYYPD